MRAPARKEPYTRHAATGMLTPNACDDATLTSPPRIIAVSSVANDMFGFLSSTPAQTGAMRAVERRRCSPEFRMSQPRYSVHAQRC